MPSLVKFEFHRVRPSQARAMRKSLVLFVEFGRAEFELLAASSGTTFLLYRYCHQLRQWNARAI